MRKLIEVKKMSEVFLEIKGVKKYFPVTGGILARKVADIKAVDDVNFSIKEGENLGLVGESGCGKTTLGRCILNLIPLSSGGIFYKGKNISKLSNPENKEFRRDTAMIFQDPFLSLHPRMTIGEIIGEPFEIHGVSKGKEKEKRVMQWLQRVGLDPYHIYRYPHQFSGGQKQRIGIARAMALNPRFIVCDEPVASLDVSVRASIINLMKKLQDELNITYLFVSHDIAVVRQTCNRIIVMYLGKIVETSMIPEIFDNPLHPYTKALLSSVPIPDPTLQRERIILEGDVPTPLNPPTGCRFHPRCPNRMPICSKEDPVKKEIDKDHTVSCHLFS
jgi:oligopeptide transport system ATP-binding protein